MKPRLQKTLFPLEPRPVIDGVSAPGNAQRRKATFMFEP